MSNVFYNAFGDFFSGNKKSIETFSNSEITKCDDYTNEEDKVICQKGYDGGADACKDVYYAAKPVCNKGVALKEAFENSQKETTGTANASSAGLGSLPKNKDQDFLALDGNLVLDGVVKATGFLKKDGTPLTEVQVLKENYVMPKDIKYTAGGNLEFKSAKTESVTTNNLSVSSFIKGNMPDTRNENKNPDEYRKMVGKGKIQEFKIASKVDVSAGGYGILTTTVPWPDTSGGKVFQRFEKDNGDKITVWERTEKDKTSWNSWNLTENIKAKSLAVDNDLQFTGKNNWILHTPDDNRRTLYVAPSKTASKTDWDWANQTKFNADGSVEMKNLMLSNADKEIIRNPKGHTVVSANGIQFGGNNNDRQKDSAQISAGIHKADSLNIVGMSTKKDANTRKVTMWAEGGFDLKGAMYIEKDIKVAGNMNVEGKLSVAGKDITEMKAEPKLVHERVLISNPINFNHVGKEIKRAYNPFGYAVPKKAEGTVRKYRIYAVYSDNMTNTGETVITFNIGSWGSSSKKVEFKLPRTWGTSSTNVTEFDRDGYSNYIEESAVAGGHHSRINGKTTVSGKSCTIKYMKLQSWDFPLE